MIWAINLADSNMDEAPVEVIEEVLEEVFGRTTKNTIFSILVTKYNLKKQDIPRNPEVFQKMLEEFLGAGGKVIENLITEKISCKKR